MKNLLLPIFLVLLILVSCSDKKKEEIEKLRSQVMAVHDEVMPKMDDIMSLKKQLKEKIAALSDSTNEAVDQDLIQKMEDAMTRLDNSHEAMMGWMRDFNSNFEDKAQDEVMTYLKEQMQKIKDVSKITSESIENAKELLQK